MLAGCATAGQSAIPAGEAAPPPEPFPDGVVEMHYASSADGSMQPAMGYFPPGSDPAPLLVGLHTWSHDYRQQPNVGNYARFAVDHGWAFIHPNFRGPNVRPEATGSEFVVADILSAVAFARSQRAIDDTRILLVGTSGGGFASLLMAGRAPQMWAGVSAWVPISDLNQWYVQTLAAGLPYAERIAVSCGGDPTKDEAARAECTKRSALTYLAHAADVPVDINAGIHDGHDGLSVPVSQSLHAYNLLAASEDRLSHDEIAFFTAKQAVPPHLVTSADDPLYGETPVLFRRSSRNVRITIFEGGHDIIYPAALEWLAARPPRTTP